MRVHQKKENRFDFIRNNPKKSKAKSPTDEEARITLEGWRPYSDEDDEDQEEIHLNFPEKRTSVPENFKKIINSLPTQTPSSLNENPRFCVTDQYYETKIGEITNDLESFDLTVLPSMPKERTKGPIRGTVKLQPISKNIEPPIKDKNSSVNASPSRKPAQTNKKPVPLQLFLLEKFRRGSQDSSQTEKLTTIRIVQPNQDKTLNLPRLPSLGVRNDDSLETQNTSIPLTNLTTIRDEFSKKPPYAVFKSIIDLNMTHHGGIRGLGPQNQHKSLVKETQPTSRVAALKKKQAIHRALGFSSEPGQKPSGKDSARTSVATSRKNTSPSIIVAPKPQTKIISKPPQQQVIKPQTFQFKLAEVLDDADLCKDQDELIQNILKKNAITNKNSRNPNSGEALNDIVKLLLNYNTQAYKAHLAKSMISDKTSCILEPQLNKNTEWDQIKGTDSSKIDYDSFDKRMKKRCFNKHKLERDKMKMKKKITGRYCNLNL